MLNLFWLIFKTTLIVLLEQCNWNIDEMKVKYGCNLQGLAQVTFGHA